MAVASSNTPSHFDDGPCSSPRQFEATRSSGEFDLFGAGGRPWTPRTPRSEVFGSQRSFTSKGYMPGVLCPPRRAPPCRMMKGKCPPPPPSDPVVSGSESGPAAPQGARRTLGLNETGKGWYHCVLFLPGTQVSPTGYVSHEPTLLFFETLSGSVSMHLMSCDDAHSAGCIQS